MILSIDHVHVLATDMDKSLDFYCNLLGFRLDRRVQFGPPERRRELAFAGLGNVFIEFLPPTDNGHPDLTGTGARPLCLLVDDMEATIADLRAKGVEITTEIRPAFASHAWIAGIKDPSGLGIELRQFRAPDGPYQPWVPERADVVRVG